MPYWIEMMRASTFYIIFESAALAVEQGTPTHAEKKLVEAFNEVFAEYRRHRELAQLQLEARQLRQAKRNFIERYSACLQGNKNSFLS